MGSLFLQLDDILKFRKYFNQFLCVLFDNLKEIYFSYFHNKNILKVELEIVFNDNKYQNLQPIYDIVIIFENDSMKKVMFEAYYLFVLILTRPSTSVSVKRNFSCLKRIKTYLRNSILQ